MNMPPDWTDNCRRAFFALCSAASRLHRIKLRHAAGLAKLGDVMQAETQLHRAQREFRAS